MIPPYRDSFAGFSGAEVDDPANQTADVYEGLMRTMHSTVYGLVGQTARERWEALERAGVLLWEEKSAVEAMLARAKQHEHDQDDDDEFDSDEETGGHKCCGGSHD